MANALKNKVLRVIIHILFVIFAVLYILAGFLDKDFLRIFKAFPLALLIILIFPNRKDKTAIKLIIGLVCGIIGDITLQYGQRSVFFGVGAAFFLCGHLLYNFAFFDLWDIISANHLSKRRCLTFLGCAFFFSLSCINLSTTVSDEMKNRNLIMVIFLPIYLVILTQNAIHCYLLLLSNENLRPRYLLLFIGYVLFFVSDNILGRTEFADLVIGSKNGNSVVIMTTYYLGQYLIVLNAQEIVNQVPETTIENGVIRSGSQQKVKREVLFPQTEALIIV